MQSYQSFGVIALVALAPLGLLLAIICGIWGKSKPKNKKVWLGQAIGFLLIAAGIIVFATTDLIAIYESAPITVQGSVRVLRQTQGKGHTSFFYVFSGQWSPQLTTDYSGTRLKNGELVSATYLSNTTDVTDLKILDGPNAGWTLHEGNGTTTSVLMLLLSGVFVLFGTISYKESSKPAVSPENVSP